MKAKNEARPLRILVAEEDRRFCTDIEIMLEAGAYEIAEVVTNGARLIEAIQRSSPDVALLSTDLQGTDIFRDAGFIQDSKLAPVVLIAAELTREQVKKAAAIEIYSILVKPLREASLLPAIEIARANWVELQSAERRLQSLERRLEARSLVENAKKILMQNMSIQETEAYRLIQLRSMNSRTSMKSISRMIIKDYSPSPTRATGSGGSEHRTLVGSSSR
jgi:response regulator NasT